jgi:hypothetical protein
MNTERLTQRLLEDRERAKARIRSWGERRTVEEIVGWNIYGMRKGPVGFYISCRACGQEFESKGWAYCEECSKIPVDERRAMKPAAQGRLCQAPGCESFVPRNARADVIYCSKACRQRAYRSRSVTDNPGHAPG